MVTTPLTMREGFPDAGRRRPQAGTAGQLSATVDYYSPSTSACVQPPPPPSLLTSTTSEISAQLISVSDQTKRARVLAQCMFPDRSGSRGNSIARARATSLKEVSVLPAHRYQPEQTTVSPVIERYDLNRAIDLYNDVVQACTDIVVEHAQAVGAEWAEKAGVMAERKWRKVGLPPPRPASSGTPVRSAGCLMSPKPYVAQTTALGSVSPPAHSPPHSPEGLQAYTGDLSRGMPTPPPSKSLNSTFNSDTSFQQPAEPADPMPDLSVVLQQVNHMEQQLGGLRTALSYHIDRQPTASATKPSFAPDARTPREQSFAWNRDVLDRDRGKESHSKVLSPPTLAAEAPLRHPVPCQYP